jgi:ribulose-phosphate 3-epimerase
MVRVWASVTTADLGRLTETAQILQTSGVDGLHVDLADGVFTPDLTFGARVVAALTSSVDIPVEAHLMVTTPEAQTRAVADAGASRVAFHLESTPYPWRLIHLIRSLGLEVGVAINPVTPAGSLGYLVDAVDLVNILSTEPDGHGEEHLGEIPARVAHVRHLMGAKCSVQVDGGVRTEHVAELVRSGADEFVVGRALVDVDDPTRVMRDLRAAARSGIDELSKQ